jgi:hypothetical protein
MQVDVGVGERGGPGGQGDVPHARVKPSPALARPDDHAKILVEPHSTAAARLAGQAPPDERGQATVWAMGMRLLIDGDPDDLLALEAALRVDPQVKGAPLERVVRDPAPGEMGPVVEALSWSAENKELIGGLAAVLAAWLASRRTRIRIRAGKREVSVSSSSVTDPESLALSLLEAMREQDDDV